MRTIPEEEFGAILSLQKKADVKSGIILSREERQKRRELGAQLKTYGLENTNYFAGLLTQVGLGEIHPETEVLLRSPHKEQVIEALCSFIMQERNTDNILLGVERASRIVKALKNYVHGGETSKQEMTDHERRRSLESN